MLNAVSVNPKGRPAEHLILWIWSQPNDIRPMRLSVYRRLHGVAALRNRPDCRNVLRRWRILSNPPPGIPAAMPIPVRPGNLAIALSVSPHSWQPHGARLPPLLGKHVG